MENKEIINRIELIKDELTDLQGQLKEDDKPKFEVGKWYKSTQGHLYFYVEKLEKLESLENPYNCYGFNSNGNWSKLTGRLLSCDGFHFTEATPEEVKTALIGEAEKRGFKEGSVFEHNHDRFPALKESYYNCGKLEYREGSLFCNGYTIMKDGKWATIIEKSETSEIETICRVLDDAGKVSAEAAEKLRKLFSNIDQCK